MEQANNLNDHIESGIKSTLRKISATDPVYPGTRSVFTKEKGSETVNFPGLSIGQFYYASVQPPKAVFETIIAKHTRMDGRLAVYKLPEFGTQAYAEFANEMATAEAQYKYRVVQAMIATQNEVIEAKEGSRQQPE